MSKIPNPTYPLEVNDFRTDSILRFKPGNTTQGYMEACKDGTYIYFSDFVRELSNHCIAVSRVITDQRIRFQKMGEDPYIEEGLREAFDEVAEAFLQLELLFQPPSVVKLEEPTRFDIEVKGYDCTLTRYDADPSTEHGIVIVPYGGPYVTIGDAVLVITDYHKDFVLKTIRSKQKMFQTISEDGFLSASIRRSTSMVGTAFTQLLADLPISMCPSLTSVNEELED